MRGISVTRESIEGMPRFVFCSGMPRSGSTWSFNVCRRLLHNAAGAERVFADYVGEGKKLDEHINRNGELQKIQIIKFHYPSQRIVNLVADDVAKNVFTIRHPLDAIASAKDVLRLPFDVALHKIKRSLEAFDVWREKSSSLFVYFDDIMADSKRQTRRVADYLGLTADDAVIERIAEETSFERARATAEKLASMPKERLAWRDGFYYDAETLYHIGHAPKGTARDWRTELSADEQRVAKAELAPWLASWFARGEHAAGDE